MTSVLHEIGYSDLCQDDVYEYLHVILPKSVAKRAWALVGGESRLLTETEWRACGIQLGDGWENFQVLPHEPHPNLFWFRRLLGEPDEASRALAEARQHRRRLPFMFVSRSAYRGTDTCPSVIVERSCVPEASLPTFPGQAQSFRSLAWAISLRGAGITEAILHRFKDIENRRRRLPVGEWIALHTGKGLILSDQDRMLQDMALDLPAPGSCPTSAVVGLCKVERVLSIRDMRAEFGCGPACEHHEENSNLTILRHQPHCRLSPFAQGPFCNVISAVIRLEKPVPAKGNVGLWRLEDAAREQILEQLQNAPTIEHVRDEEGMQLPRAWPLPFVSPSGARPAVALISGTKGNKKSDKKNKESSVKRSAPATGTGRSKTSRGSGVTGSAAAESSI